MPAAFPWAVFPWAASALRTPQPVPAAGEAQGRWNGEATFLGVPKAQEVCWHGLLPFAFPPHRCHPKAGGQSWELQRVFSPAMGAEGMCPWQGGTGVGTLGMGTLSPALGAIVSLDCHTACPGHHTKGTGGTMLVVWGTGDMADMGSGSASLCLSPAVF